MKKLPVVLAAVAVIVAVGLGGYKFGEYQALNVNQKQLNHCLDVADNNRDTSIESLNYLESFGRQSSQSGI